MARSYEGSHARLKQLVRKALRGEELILSALGGSGKNHLLSRNSVELIWLVVPVTGGHGVNKDEIWFSRLGEWFEKFVQPDRSDRIGYVKVNGAVPGKSIVSSRMI
jgi:hypothetical protein